MFSFIPRIQRYNTLKRALLFLHKDTSVCSFALEWVLRITESRVGLEQRGLPPWKRLAKTSFLQIASISLQIFSTLMLIWVSVIRLMSFHAKILEYSLICHIVIILKYKYSRVYTVKTHTHTHKRMHARFPLQTKMFHKITFININILLLIMIISPPITRQTIIIME